MPDIHHRAVVVCKTTILTCVDFRIHEKGLQNFVPRRHWPADVITLPGAVQEVVRLDTTRMRVECDLSLVVGIHSAETLFLFSHTDCAKYGGREVFRNTDAEYKTLWTDLLKAKTLIASSSHPELRNLDVRLGIIRTGTTEVLRF